MTDYPPTKRLMAPPCILVVAPENDLTLSLKFALAAERFDVTWIEHIGVGPESARYECTIVDHHALGPDLAAARLFVMAFRPVVLLANQLHELSPHVFRTIVKPGLGAAVIDAVREALSLPTQNAT